MAAILANSSKFLNSTTFQHKKKKSAAKREEELAYNEKERSIGQ